MNRFITTQQAADILSIDKMSVSRLCRSGKIEGRKFGYYWMVDPDSVEEYRQATQNKDKNDPTRSSNRYL